jgi:hypothetical protein
MRCVDVEIVGHSPAVLAERKFERRCKQMTRMNADGGDAEKL